MREAWIRKPINWFEKVEWRQFWGKGGQWWLDKRFYFQDGKSSAEEIAECVADPNLFDDGYKHSFSARHTHGIILCSCGRQVHLMSHWANACGCLKGDGSSLAPRSLWGF